MDKAYIKTKIPHREPMLLLDRVVELHAARIVCEKTFTADEVFHHGHYPGHPIIPGFILCECAAQAGAVLAAHGQTLSGVPLLTRASEIKFKRMVRPGETLRIEVTIQEQLGGALYFAARILTSDTLAASLSFAVKLSNPE